MSAPTATPPRAQFAPPPKKRPFQLSLAAVGVTLWNGALLYLVLAR